MMEYVVGLLIGGGLGYVLGQLLGVDKEALAQKAKDAYDRGWHSGFETGERTGRQAGWFAAYRHALAALKATPFSAPLKHLVKKLAAGEQPAPSGNAPDVLPILKQHSEAMRAISVTTPSPVTLTGDGPE